MPLVEAKNPIQKENFSIDFRKPSNFPDAEENESKVLYVTGIKESSPMQYFTSCGITFEKYVLSPEASLSKNQGKHAVPGIMCRRLTAKQVDYLRKRLEEQTVRYQNKDGLIVEEKAINIVIFKPASQYNPIESEDMKQENQVNTNVPKYKKG